MLPYLLLLTVVVNLAAYSYLDVYHQAGFHPVPSGFSASSSLSTLFRTIALVWLFGWISGILVAVLTLFDILTYSFFWVFMIPAAMKVVHFGGHPEQARIHPIPAWLWQISVVALPLIFVVCLFTYPFAPLEIYLHSIKQIGAFVAAIGAGFVGRILFVRLYDARR
jgi:hypothetical protein